MAPNTIHRTAAVIMSPWAIEADTRAALICHWNSAIKTVMIKATGIAFLAGQFKPTSKMAATTMGENAMRA
jgi:hypothetical protein